MTFVVAFRKIKKSKLKKGIRVGNDKYPFEVCTTRFHPLRQYYYLKACLPSL